MIHHFITNVSTFSDMSYRNYPLPTTIRSSEGGAFVKIGILTFHWDITTGRLYRHMVYARY